MPLINVKLIEGVFSSEQKAQIVERLTDAMVSVEGENMRGGHLVPGRGAEERRVGHRRPRHDHRGSAVPGRGRSGRLKRPGTKRRGAARKAAPQPPFRL